MTVLKKAPLILLSVLILTLGGLALAQDQPGPGQPAPGEGNGPPPGRPGPGGRSFRALSPEQRESLAKLRADFRAKTLPILDQIQDNRLIYKALVNNNNASTDEVKKAVAELSRLRKELRAEKDDFRKSLSELGLPGQFGRGYGCRGDWGDRDDLDDRDDGDDRYDWDDGDDRYDWDDGPRRHRGGRSHRY